MIVVNLQVRDGMVATQFDEELVDGVGDETVA
jgi:hypothetical protein